MRTACALLTLPCFLVNWLVKTDSVQAGYEERFPRCEKVTNFQHQPKGSGLHAQIHDAII